MEQTLDSLRLTSLLPAMGRCLKEILAADQGRGERSQKASLIGKREKPIRNRNLAVSESKILSLSSTNGFETKRAYYVGDRPISMMTVRDQRHQNRGESKKRGI